MLYEGKTYEEYLELVKERGLSLAFVPDEYRTYELCLEAIKVNPNMNIDCVPDKHKTYELCFEVVKNSFLNRILSIIPDKHRTYELCLKVVKNKVTNMITVLNHIPEEHKTYELCLEVVSRIPNNSPVYNVDKAIPKDILLELEKNNKFRVMKYKCNPEDE